MSMEAKASAAIIGSLPFIVSLLVFLTTPSYIAILFTDMRGNLILAASLVWMGCGIMMMRTMITFRHLKRSGHHHALHDPFIRNDDAMGKD